MTRTITLSLLAFLAVPGRGQLPVFEIATVKIAAPTEGGGRALAGGDRVTLRNTTLLSALARAFRLKFANQIVGPTWIRTERYDIVAKAADNTPQDQIPAMLQALLIERFQLVLRRETRELPAYALVMGKGPLKLVENESNPKDSATLTGPRRHMTSTSMATLAQFASQTLRTPVLDLTGLAGHYDFQYEYSREETGDTTDNPRPSIFTVIADLGLKLESRKAPFEVIVIESGNKSPTEH
jgi:uncharacterized protein (TIGR03435 family)